ncbi:class I adenylate-forming enzyme family protein [Desertibacillus haloalkaliphilus]|uniref:class I adenylate-forming enzyme family protein n=1 Tax=Desertibacillus haloalkaliphilus TaxID=1328930 RepID=UPI001C25B3A3|nr:AMP-binding protein [Desertibacillus haloalkaliphilus]MBU8906943.1 AMP-binding protein [Desertibacillus haloalkaliphilus]
MKNWPTGVSKELTYRLGKKPLHEYVRENARQTPNKIAYIFYGKEVTWQELDDQADRLAQFLVSQGIQKGDRMGLYMQNCPQYVISHYAVQKIGAIVCPLNPMYKEAELEYLINEIGARGVIAAQELSPMIINLRDKAPTLELIITTNYADYLPPTPTLPLPSELKLEKSIPEQTYDFQKIISDYESLTNHEQIDIDDVALMVFTSGTTGRPKGAMLTYENALFKTAASVHVNGVRGDDRWLAVMPLCHIAGMVMGVNIPVYSNTPCVLLTRFEPETVISAIEQYQVSVWHSIAPMNAGLLNVPGIKERNLSSLRKNLATSFGTPVTAELAEQWKQVTGGCQMYEAAYGLSETHTCDTFMPPDRVKFGSCGIPVYETDLRIVDLDTGEGLPPGKHGEIVIKNPGVFKGYWNRPDATKETLREGWVYTGDIGHISEDGFLYFNGRVKEMIKCSGYSVFPEDVEALMMDHPAIAQVAVIGVPDEVRGESVKAVIVPNKDYVENVTEDDIIEWAKQKMAAYKYPRYVEFRESLPATSAGKVLRRLLKEPSNQ